MLSRLEAQTHFLKAPVRRRPPARSHMFGRSLRNKYGFAGKDDKHNRESGTEQDFCRRPEPSLRSAFGGLGSWKKDLERSLHSSNGRATPSSGYPEKSKGAPFFGTV